MKLALKVGVFLIVIVSVASAAMVASHPDSYPANVIQMNRRDSLQGALIRYEDQKPLVDRTVVLMFHGWSNEASVSAMPTRATVVNTFAPALLHWKVVAPDLLGDEFENHFLPVLVQYPP